MSAGLEVPGVHGILRYWGFLGPRVSGGPWGPGGPVGSGGSWVPLFYHAKLPSVKNSVLKKFANFTQENTCAESLFNNVPG